MMETVKRSKKKKESENSRGKENKEKMKRERERTEAMEGFLSKNDEHQNSNNSLYMTMKKITRILLYLWVEYFDLTTK